jgi:hypothetical protein
MTDSTIDITGPFDSPRKLLKIVDTGEVTAGDGVPIYSIGAAVTSFVSGLEIPAHDYISLSYTGLNLTGVVYKTGGSSGTTVATLTLAYTGSDLISVTRT